MSRAKQILTKLRVVEGLEDSGIVKVLSNNLSKTQKRGGPVNVSTNRQTLAVSLSKKDGKWDSEIFPNEADEHHKFQASFSKSGKWKLIHVAGVAKELGVPIKLVGVGEKMEDLKDFKAAEFVDKLFL